MKSWQFKILLSQCSLLQENHINKYNSRETLTTHKLSLIIYRSVSHGIPNKFIKHNNKKMKRRLLTYRQLKNKSTAISISQQIFQYSHHSFSRRVRYHYQKVKSKQLHNSELLIKIFSLKQKFQALKDLSIICRDITALYLIRGSELLI